jgi:TolA-binding protein
MAAVLLLMIGASLVLMRARPGDRDSVQVTERGVPENEGESVVIVPRAEKPPGSDPPSAAQAHGALDEASEARRGRAKGEASPIARADEPAPAPAPTAAAPAAVAADLSAGSADGGEVEYNEAMDAYRGGRFAEAQRLFDDIAKSGGTNAASASLFAAQSARSSSGCGSAAERFDQVNVRYPGSHIGNEAAWQAADCYRALGQNDRARRNYQALLAAPAYAERAQRAMDELTLAENEVASRRARAKAAAPAARPPAAAPAKRSAPQNPAADTKGSF